METNNESGNFNQASMNTLVIMRVRSKLNDVYFYLSKYKYKVHNPLKLTNLWYDHYIL